MKDTAIFKRREMTFTGGDTNCGKYLPKQTVTIGRCVEEDEDLWTVTDVNGKTYRVDGCDLSPHPEAELTNEEFIGLMLNWSKTAMMQPFVLIAIEEYAKQVAQADAAALDTPMMSGQLWKDTALEALGWFAARELVANERRKELTPAG